MHLSHRLDGLHRGVNALAYRIAPVAGAARALTAHALHWYRQARRAAHRARYVPLACVALGAILMWLGPKPHPGAGDQLDDGSMLPTIIPGELMRVDHHAFTERPPLIGELVTFRPPAIERCAAPVPHRSSCRTTGRAPAAGEGIKRIVAGPGDWVAILEGRLIRDGRPVAEPYVRVPCTARAICDLPRPVHLPPGTWWLLADNRNAPNDSRSYGPIPSPWIDGLVIVPAGATTSVAGASRRGGHPGG